MTEVLQIEYITSLEIKAWHNTRMSVSQSGRSQVADYGGGYFEIDLETSLPRNIAKHITAFLGARHGGGERFKLCLPGILDSSSNYNGTIAVSGANQAGSLLNVNAAINKTILKAGDYISLDSHDKVYQVTGDVTTDGSGNAVIHVSPDLVTAPIDDDAVIYRDVPLMVVYTGDTVSYSYSPYRNVPMSLSFREAWKT